MTWYITVAAVHEYQAIIGWPVDDDGPNFDDAAKRLDKLCDVARLKKNEGHREIYEVKDTIGGRRVRLELTVSLADRPEGPLPQLVRVRRKR